MYNLGKLDDEKTKKEFDKFSGYFIINSNIEEYGLSKEKIANT